MNRLIERAPSSVDIDGQIYPINTNWVDCLKTSLALQDEALLPAERVDILLYNLYPDAPHNALEAVKQALWFLRCGRDRDEDHVVEKLCDFAQDGEFIYNAMLKKGVDLDKSDGMHFWTFMGHFAEIPESSFTRIVYLRSRKNKGKLSKEERAECGRVGWDIINMTSEEEKREREEEKDFIDNIMKRYE